MDLVLSQELETSLKIEVKSVKIHEWPRIERDIKS